VSGVKIKIGSSGTLRVLPLTFIVGRHQSGRHFVSARNATAIYPINAGIGYCGVVEKAGPQSCL